MRSPTPLDSSIKENIECYSKDGVGSEYRGSYSSAEKGLQCISWEKLHRRHKWHPRQNPNAGLESNYCRNPDNDVKGPWCYVSLRRRGVKNSKNKYQYCSDIPYCEDLNKQFISSRSISPEPLTYDVQPTTALTTSHTEPFLVTKLRTTTTTTTTTTSSTTTTTIIELTTTTTTTTSLEPTTTTTTSTTSRAASRRNLNFENLSNHNLVKSRTRHQRRRHPNIRNNLCQRGDGSNYRGTIARSYDGQECKYWSDIPQRNPFHPNHEKNKEKDLYLNYCRNPDNDPRGPWCYVKVRTVLLELAIYSFQTTKRIRYQYCHVRMCRRDSLSRNNEAKVIKNSISILKGKPSQVQSRQATNTVVNPLQNLEKMRSAIQSIDLRSK